MGCVHLTDFGRCQLVDNPSKDTHTHTHAHTQKHRQIDSLAKPYKFQTFRGIFVQVATSLFKEIPRNYKESLENYKNSPLHLLETSGVVGNY